VSSSELVTKDEAVKQLMSTTEGKKTYSVISGDTLSGIASENGISTKDLLSINPDLQISSTLKIGQVINLTVPKTMVSVRTTEKTVYTEPVEKSVEYQYTTANIKIIRVPYRTVKTEQKK